MNFGSDAPDLAASSAYRQRRDEIAARAAAYVLGEPIPEVDYTDAEHALWRLVSGRLADRHRYLAAPEFLEAVERLGVGGDGVPQLQEVSDRLDRLTGFRLRPASGVVPFALFCGSLADGYFHSTQYLRDGVTPFYSTEPDILHEVIGHGSALADDRFADLYRVAGEAVRRVESEVAVQFVAKTFWFTLECGLLDSSDGPRAYGASIVSSYGELEHFRSAEVRPLDMADMVQVDYDITQYQTTLYSARSLAHLEDVAGEFWASCDDASIEKILAVDI
ncbi:phenylalanine 4-monooxygenase [Streptomyces sp. TRM70350]|uniref:phenylalanine 4-monooxygenase n=1 Tax=Streptomyces sp. TRM70350 TaxID=2856165 RepID=UPI001C485638|nr:phenylalanine 4-monooxygenase [Streptomyces sp. TRM70350]MBV7698617.1 phenylalanine 4-monooxygenase [Streptomyces sp. TRM70350]